MSGFFAPIRVHRNEELNPRPTTLIGLRAARISTDPSGFAGFAKPLIC